MNRTWWIFRKEVREMVRDKRVFFGAFVGPVFLVLLFVMLLGTVERAVLERPSLRIAVVAGTDNVLVSALRLAGNRIVRVRDQAAGIKAVEDGRAKVFLQTSPDFDRALDRGGANVVVHYDEAAQLSGLGLSALRQAVEAINREHVRGILRDFGVADARAEPVSFEAQPVKKPVGLAGSAIVNLLPYLIVLWAFYGGFSIVADMVAGEKEKGTLETLLVSPARRSEIALGKFFALMVIGLLSSLSSLVAVLLLGALNLPATRQMFPTGLAVSAESAVAFGVVLLPLVAMFSGLLLTVSAAAKSMREAQTWLTLLSFIVLMPAIFSQFAGLTGADRAVWAHWTPVLNSALALRSALLDQVSWGAAVTCALVSLVLAVGFLGVAVRLFRHEQIVARS